MSKVSSATSGSCRPGWVSPFQRTSPAVGGIGEDQLERVRRPAVLARRRCGFRVEGAGDRGRAELPFRVKLEDAPDYRCLHLVGHEQLGLFVAGVAVRRSAAHPFAFADAAFQPGGDAVDNRRVLELCEHAEHLQHHPPRRGAGVERLGRRLQDDVELIELLAQPGELTHLAAEPVDAVDEQQVDPFLAREVERLLEAGAVEAGPGGLVLMGGDDPPVLHRLAVALQPLPLRLQRGWLVVLVGRDPLVETDSHHGRPPRLAWSSMRPSIPPDVKSLPRRRVPGPYSSSDW